MRRTRNVKILATLGPASSDKDTLRALFDAGADAFRLNMSHSDHQGTRERYAMIRALEEEVGRPIAILADLQGPKIRVGEFSQDEIVLVEGRNFTLDNDPTPGNIDRAHLPHDEILSVLSPGADLLLDDGKIRLQVTSVENGAVQTEVMVGGILKSRKGVNVPNTLLPLDALTEKDRIDLDLCLELGVDWVALSFVQRPEDVIRLKNIVKGRAGVMAKLEKPAAIESIAEIIDAADAVMVARGDLGVELPVEEVPGLQKAIILAGRHSGKPVVVATQMLESMIEAPVPTRAEVSDVATAVFDGADAVMLSAESATGSFPVQSVAMMNRIAKQVESEPQYQEHYRTLHATPEATSADAITAAARQVSETLNVAAIVTYTTSGSTSLRAARERPGVPVIAITPIADTARRLTLVWGLHCVVTDDAKDFRDMVDKACKIARADHLAKPNDLLAITAGVPFGTPGATNSLRIVEVPENDRK